MTYKSLRLLRKEMKIIIMIIQFSFVVIQSNLSEHQFTAQQKLQEEKENEEISQVKGCIKVKVANKVIARIRERNLIYSLFVDYG